MGKKTKFIKLKYNYKNSDKLTKFVEKLDDNTKKDINNGNNVNR